MLFVKPLRGSRYSSALLTSSVHLTNPRMTCSVAAAVRCRLILEMLQKLSIADLHAPVTWDSIVVIKLNIKITDTVSEPDKTVTNTLRMQRDFFYLLS